MWYIYCGIHIPTYLRRYLVLSMSNVFTISSYSILHDTVQYLFDVYRNKKVILNEYIESIVLKMKIFPKLVVRKLMIVHIPSIIPFVI